MKARWRMDRCVIGCAIGGAVSGILTPAYFLPAGREELGSGAENMRMALFRPLPTELDDLVSAIFWILPVLILMFLCGTVFSRDFERCGIYIFTRSRSRSRWYIRKSVKLLALAVVYYAMHAAACLCLVAGKTGGNVACTAELVLLFIALHALFGCIMLQIQNLAGIFAGSHIGYLAAVLLTIILAICAMAAYNSSAIKLAFLANPLAHLNYERHTDVGLQPVQGMDFTLAESFICYGTMWAILFVVGYGYINHADIGICSREES